MPRKKQQTYEASEHGIQSAYFDWVRRMSEIDNRYKRIFAITNEARESDSARLYHWREGKKAGVWDVFIAVARECSGGAFIEFKTSVGKLSESQKAWRELVQAEYATEVCRTTEQAIQFTRNYLK